jgi:hypothetical protein
MEKQIAKEKIAEALRNYAQQNGNGGAVVLCEDNFEQLADVAASSVAGEAEGKRYNGPSAPRPTTPFSLPYGIK